MSGTSIIVFAFFVVYQQVENHLLQPLIYGRTVRLSALAILISVLIGAEVAGVVGALVASPPGARSRSCSTTGGRRHPSAGHRPSRTSPQPSRSSPVTSSQTSPVTSRVTRRTSSVTSRTGRAKKRRSRTRRRAALP